MSRRRQKLEARRARERRKDVAARQAKPPAPDHRLTQTDDERAAAEAAFAELLASQREPR